MSDAVAARPSGRNRAVDRTVKLIVALLLAGIVSVTVMTALRASSHRDPDYPSTQVGPQRAVVPAYMTVPVT